MAYTSYRKMAALLDDCKPFTGNSVTARNERGCKGRLDTRGGSGFWYCVYSYKTLIFALDVVTLEVMYWDITHYSRTTDRIQRMIAVAFNEQLTASGLVF